MGNSGAKPDHGCQSMGALTVSAPTMHKHVPSPLRTQMPAGVPPDAKVMSRGCRDADEDDNIAIFVDDGVDRVCLQDCLYEIIVDDDDTHGTAPSALRGPRVRGPTVLVRH